jgi:hypothetical protein
MKFTRRSFLKGTVVASAAFGAGFARADELPPNANPRAIFGDTVEPDWEQRFTITVGPKKADLVGTTDRVIQSAVDYVARKGGGTVHVQPGTYRLRNSVPRGRHPLSWREQGIRPAPESYRGKPHRR